ncbi:hypothetical protein NDU88_006209 [Pleurodeles waltl]|uniref:Uncharacterized protein n=1 Tax=Pleurodeles waltl TaxID=8319 RepID=A0AAV7NSL0_PLEWA|nr:hypothetical protein NDU88_006209 [Pleurodeles waltl]
MCSRVTTTPLQTVPTGPAKQFPGGAFLHPEVLSSDVDPGVGFETPEDEEPAQTPREEEEPARMPKGGEERTETPKKEKEAELGEEDARTPKGEEPPEDISSRRSASHVPGGTWLSQDHTCNLKPVKYYWRKGLF